MKVFISHVHGLDGEIYREILDGLRAIKHFLNLSISEDARIHILMEKHERLLRELDILYRRQSSVNEQAEKLRQTARAIIQKNLEEIVVRENPVQERINKIDVQIECVHVEIEQRLNQYRASEFFSERVVARVQREYSEQLEALTKDREVQKSELRDHAEKDARRNNAGGLQDIERQISRLDSERRSIDQRIVGIRSNERYPSSIDFAMSKNVNNDLIREAPDVAVAIYDAISQCDLFIVIGRAYSQYRRWLEFEMQTAQALGRPILGVIPGQQEIPRELQFNCDRTICWDGRESVHELGSFILSMSAR